MNESLPSRSQLDGLDYQNKYELEGWCCFKTRPQWNDMPNRTIISNVPDSELPTNVIRTCKYTMWTFLPLNLLEQFSKMANIYFLIIGYLETVPSVTITDGKPVIWFPLFIVVTISAIKDFLEDRKRMVSDDEENFRHCHIVQPQGIKQGKWEEIQVGDVIKVMEDEYLPADIVVLKTSEKGQCFIETKNLDGETNLKVKKCHKGLSFLRHQQDLYQERIFLKYEKPNPYLYQFKGQIILSHDPEVDSVSRASVMQSNINRKLPIDEQNFILRGCSLKNTEWIYGLVVYTGFDTKIMLNSTKSRPKHSTLEQYMNLFIILVFFMQLVLCLFSAQYSAFWQLRNYYDLGYLEMDEDELQDNIIISTLEKWGTWMLIFNNFVPISLIVTLEMVKFLQGIVIDNDKNCVGNGFHAEVQSSNLNEELGSVNLVFSDKTGTITKNLMEFKTVSIFGRSYGQSEIEMDQEDFEECPSVSNVDFNDGLLFQDMKGEHRQFIDTFFIHLSTCHTIMVQNTDGVKHYNSSSPDELALVMGAKFCGYEYLGTDQDGILSLKHQDQLIQYEILHILEFSSARKRMSVIVKDGNDKISILTKGADSMIMRLLDEVDQKSQLLQTTLEHLGQYAEQGLRTLMLAQRDIDKEEYDQWLVDYNEAQCSDDRERQIEIVQDRIEKQLKLIGATGIEDKLQDYVGQVIQRLNRAGIKLWMLTGDKLETAINISYSCKLINDTFQKIIIQGDNTDEVTFRIYQSIDLINSSYGRQFCLIINADALIHLDPKMHCKLIELSQLCVSVIACRVSPKQKQEIVQMVKEQRPSLITLAIGDGANDVNMITAAHIGIGIKGVEGHQASRAADYSIGEFQIIQNLLLHHGRECLRRNQQLVGYNFYKNLLIVLPHFWYSFNNGFSPLNLYDPWLFQFYNLFFTSTPIVLYAVLDEQYSWQFLLQQPQLYLTVGKISVGNIFANFLEGALHSAVVINAVYPSMELTSIDKHGRILFFSAIGMAIFCYAIIVANLQIFVISYMNTMASIVVIFISCISFLLSYFMLSDFTSTLDISHTFMYLIWTYQFYIVLLAILAMTFLIDIGIIRWQMFQNQMLIEEQVQQKKQYTELTQDDQVKDYNKQPSSQIPQLVHSGTLRSPKTLDFNKQQSIYENYQDDSQIFSQRPILSRKYTGYAFAQQEKVLDEALRTAQN